MVFSTQPLSAFLALIPAISANIVSRQDSGALDSCPGYRASNVETTDSGLTASLTLAGTACNVYGTDLEELTLTVEYQSGMRHLKRFLTNTMASS